MSREAEPAGWLGGKILIAMPGMGDPRFERAVVYVCAHSAEGAMGLVVNHPQKDLTVPELLVKLEIVPEDERIRLPAEVGRLGLRRGGPVDGGRGFVLHSDDFQVEGATLTVADRVCLTTTLDILRAIARGEGPRRALLALGYSGWSPGQLEGEIRDNGWLVGEADPDLIFAADGGAVWPAALRGLGIEAAALSSEAGRA
ncbi:MAG: YqgE/AlgH family protein [Hyphomicrobiales bacterium]|nr:YqgE/AlgH family protein [Hyphomicrobiales bacterium]